MEDHKQIADFIKQGKYEEAAKHLNEAIEKNPKDSVAYSHFGHLLSIIGDHERAISFYKKAIEIEPTLSTAIFGLGNVYFDQENYELAVKFFSATLKKRASRSRRLFYAWLKLLSHGRL
ncbi:MAG: tetratricopeptide repeat protein [Bacillaceae bacterium]|nr:tetratricopeptide repeat protein [Bacillaceae bacterium]